MNSLAPSLVYEEGDIIKRTIRDIYNEKMNNIIVEGNEGYQKAKKIITEKIDDLHKIAKALLLYETLSGEEIKDLILKDTQPIRKTEENDKEKEQSSALGSLGLKPKPAV